jgi:S1-C subfamily serine protease
MRRLILALLFLPVIGFCQVNDLNAYKYVVISQEADPLGLGRTVSQELKSYGVKSFLNGRQIPADFIDCQALYGQLIYKPYETFSQTVRLKLTDCDGNLIAQSKASCAVCGFTIDSELRKASQKAVRKLKPLKRYQYDPTILKHTFPDVELTNETEKSLRSYFESNVLHDIEGVYKSTEESGNSYTLGLKKYDNHFKAIIIKADYGHWREGEVKFVLKQTATKGLYSSTYFFANKKKKDIFLSVATPGLLTFKVDSKNAVDFIKMFPHNSSVGKKIANREWKGNGSGIFVSENGYIATNHHVIDKASEIEVEFKQNNEVVRFNARVIQTDERNDLAIVKIDDNSFSNVGALPYSFKTSGVDVGSDVYALGYPKALTVMGKEIKFTDGRISSKTGFKGDVTSYQSTTPIQPGNSGGPLFDFEGNLVGINSAKIIAEDVEGASYSIKSIYLANLIDVLPETIPLPSSKQLASKALTEQIKVVSDYVVLIKVK